HGQRDPSGDPDDYFRIDLSNDGGATFPANVLLWGDQHRAATWTDLSVRLEEYLPLTSAMVLRLRASDGVTDGDIIEAGVDDVAVIAGDGNEAPSAPTPVSPADGGSVPADEMLVVTNAVDPDGDALTYTFVVYADPLLTGVVRTVSGIAEGATETAWTIDPPLADGAYAWRAYAEDASLRGETSIARSFTVGELVDVPPAVTEIRVAAPSPNPFRAETSIRFALPAPSEVRADVFDVTGRHLRRLHRGLLPEGAHAFAWDGADRRGRAVSSGQYFVQVVVDGAVFTRKVIVIE
ncbi:MAG: FlgD immunoglobulin-like domain containing protein, partial [Planctomycetota bacterium]